MRILVYAETPEALAECEELRAEGHNASLCNPEFFASGRVPKAEKVITWDKDIAAVYKGLGVEVDYRGKGKVKPVTPEEPIEPTSVEVGGGLHEDTVAAVEKKLKTKKK